MRALWLGFLISITFLPGCGGDSGDDSGEHVVTGFNYGVIVKSGV